MNNNPQQPLVHRGTVFTFADFPDCATVERICRNGVLVEWKGQRELLPFNAIEYMVSRRVKS